MLEVIVGEQLDDRKVAEFGIEKVSGHVHQRRVLRRWQGLAVLGQVADYCCDEYFLVHIQSFLPDPLQIAEASSHDGPYRLDAFDVGGAEQ